MANTKEIVTADKSTGTIPCLTIPLHDETVLLPNAAIAEIIAYKEPTPSGDTPEWFLGYIEWREKRVPLISFEAISGKKVIAARKNSRIAILNTLNGNVQLPYVGILSQGIPGLAIIQDQGLDDKRQKKRQAVAAFVKLAGGQALIPDIDEIEQHLIHLSL